LKFSFTLLNFFSREGTLYDISVPRFSYTNLNQFKFPDFRHFKQLLTLYDYKFCKQPTDKTEQQDYDKSTFKCIYAQRKIQELQ